MAQQKKEEKVEMAPDADAQEAKELAQRQKDLETIAKAVSEVQDAREAVSRDMFRQYNKGFKPNTDSLLRNEKGEIAQPENFNLPDHCAKIAMELGHEVYPWKRVKPAAHIDLEKAPTMWATRSTENVTGWCKWSKPTERAVEHGFTYMKASWGGELFKPKNRAKPNSDKPGGPDRGYIVKS